MSMDGSSWNESIGSPCQKKCKQPSLGNARLHCSRLSRTDNLYTFFLRWNPERALDPLLDDTSLSSNLDHSSSNPTDQSSGGGFVLLANDDPELTDDYLPANHLETSNSDHGKQGKAHYLKRQNTLLKEWEVRTRAAVRSLGRAGS